jgi:hypothetical protein
MTSRKVSESAETGATSGAGEIGARERLAYLAIFAALLCARLPDVVLHGRFWAEEGKVFFARAWTMPWYEALLAPHGGYLNIVANAGGLLASRFPLELAPYVTTALGLLFQLAPAIVLLTARDAWLQGRTVLLLALVLIAVPPASEEVWLQTLHAQFHLIVCGALVLALKPASGAVEAFRGSMLVIGALSGPGMAALMPLFILRAILDRSPARAMQAFLIGLGAVLQFGVFFTDIPERSHSVDVGLLLSIVGAKHVIIPFLGTVFANEVLAGLYEAVVSGHIPVWTQFAAVAAFVAVGAAVLLRGNSAATWLFLAGVCVTAVSFYGALGNPAWLILVDGAPRYAYAQQAIFNLVVLGIAATGRDLLSKVAWCVVAWVVVIGAQSYFVTQDSVAHGPDWRGEVEMWRQDPSRELKIWPEDWDMTLPAEAGR